MKIKHCHNKKKKERTKQFNTCKAQKKPLFKKLTEHKTLTFQNYRLEKRLLRELRQKMAIVIIFLRLLPLLISLLLQLHV